MYLWRASWYWAQSRSLSAQGNLTPIASPLDIFLFPSERQRCRPNHRIRPPRKHTRVPRGGVRFPLSGRRLPGAPPCLFGGSPIPTGHGEHMHPTQLVVESGSVLFPEPIPFQTGRQHLTHPAYLHCSTTGGAAARDSRKPVNKATVSANGSGRRNLHTYDQRFTGTITYGISRSRSGYIRPAPSFPTTSTKYIRSHFGSTKAPGIVPAYWPLSPSADISAVS
jgi:hypothetical protein